MNHVKYICEYGTIWNSKDFHPGVPEDSPNCIYLDDKSFESLKSFVTENNDQGTEIEEAFSYHRKKRKDYIRVKNYVGVIETREGTTIEILPKIYTGNYTDNNQIKESRKILLSMLRTLKDSPFKTIDSAHLNSTRMPILEIFISVFIKETELILKKGIKHFYAPCDENQKYLKGRLLFSRHVKINSTRADRFFISYDEFKAEYSSKPNIKKRTSLS